LLKGSKQIAPLTAFRDVAEIGLLNDVPTLNFHPLTIKDTKSVHPLARQPIDLDRPHLFIEAGNTQFNCFLWIPPIEQRAGDISSSTRPTSPRFARGTDSLRTSR
jgi:hypothetical protein